MSFLPCPAASSRPDLFTVTNNLTPLPCSPLVASTPTPRAGPRGSIPVPLTVTLQGLIEESAGVIRVTNGTVLEIP